MPWSAKTALNTFVRVDAERLLAGGGGRGSNALVETPPMDDERAELEKCWPVKTGNGAWTGRGMGGRRDTLFFFFFFGYTLCRFFSLLFSFRQREARVSFPFLSSKRRVGGRNNLTNGIFYSIPFLFSFF